MAQEFQGLYDLHVLVVLVDARLYKKPSIDCMAVHSPQYVWTRGNVLDVKPLL